MQEIRTTGDVVLSNIGNILYEIVPCFNDYLTRSRWFGGKSLTLKNLSIYDYAVVSKLVKKKEVFYVLLLLKVKYEINEEIYFFPILLTNADNWPTNGHANTL